MKKLLLLMTLLFMSVTTLGSEISNAKYRTLLTYIQQNQVAENSEAIFDIQYQQNDPLRGKNLPKNVLLKQDTNPPPFFKNCYRKTNVIHRLSLDLWVNNNSC